MADTDTNTRTEASLRLQSARKYCDGIEAHIDAGGIAGTDNVRDLVAFVRTLDRHMSAVIAREAELRAALEASNRTLIAGRDSFYDSVTTSYGEITDPADGEELARLDALIDANNKALRTQGDGHE